MALAGAKRDYSPDLFSVDSEDEDSLLVTSSLKRHCLSPCSVQSSDGSPVYLSDSDTNTSTNSDGAPVYLSDDDSVAQTVDSDNLSIVTHSPVLEPAKICGHDDESCLGFDEPPPPARVGDRQEVSHILVGECCSGECLLKLNAQNILPIRRKMKSLGMNEKRQWLMDKILESSRVIEPGKVDTTFLVAGREVCKLAWCIVHGISLRQLTRVTKCVSLGQVTTEHGNRGKKRYNTKSSGAKAWMSRYFHLIGDKMPHNDQIHLPSWETQKDLFVRYEGDMIQQGLTESDIVSLSTFYRIWNEDFPNVVIPEVHIYTFMYMYIHRCIHACPSNS